MQYIVECGNFCSLDIIDTMASYYWDDPAVRIGIEKAVWARLEWKANRDSKR